LFIIKEVIYKKRKEEIALIVKEQDFMERRDFIKATAIAGVSGVLEQGCSTILIHLKIITGTFFVNAQKK